MKKTGRMEVITGFVVLALLAGALPARATVGPPVKIYMPANSKQAVAGQEFRIAPGSTYTHQGSFLGVFGASTTGLFDNDGTFVKAVDTGTRSIDVFTDNSGEIRVEAGTLVLSRGSTTSGDFVGEPGATIQFTGGSHELLPGSSLVADKVRFESGINGNRTVRGTWNVANSVVVAGQPLTFTNEANIVNYGPVFNITSGIVNFDKVIGGTTHFDSLSLASGAANFNSGDPVECETLTNGPGTISGPGPITVNGMFNWLAGGVVNGPGVIHANGGLFIGPGGSQKGLFNRVLNNAATATFQGALILHTGGQINNLATGLMDLQVDGTILHNQNGALSNTGTLIRTTAAGTATIAVPTTNTGTVQSQTGTLAFGHDYIQTAGQTILNGGNLAMSGSPVKPLQIQGGLLKGAGTITGNVINSAGTVAPGLSGGILNIVGNYTHGSSAALMIEVGNTTPGTGHDKVTASGTVTIQGGTLDIQPLPPFIPQVGQQFVIVASAGVQGTFTTATHGPGDYDVIYNPTNVTVVVLESPPCDLTIPPDFDDDCDVDVTDLTAFIDCADGPEVAVTPECAAKDLDADGDADQVDFAVIQICWSGYGIQADPNCTD